MEKHLVLQKVLLMDWHWGWHLVQQMDWQMELHSGWDCQKVQRRGRNFHWDSLRVRHWERLMDWQKV